VPGDGTVTPPLADAWRAILLRQPRWRAEAEVRASSETGDWPADVLAELGSAEPGQVTIDLASVDARPRAGSAAPLALELRDGSDGPPLAEALSRLPAFALIGRRYRRTAA
jgi:hypothetical protein